MKIKNKIKKQDYFETIQIVCKHNIKTLNELKKKIKNEIMKQNEEYLLWNSFDLIRIESQLNVFKKIQAYK